MTGIVISIKTRSFCAKCFRMSASACLAEIGCARQFTHQPSDSADIADESLTRVRSADFDLITAVEADLVQLNISLKTNSVQIHSSLYTCSRQTALPSPITLYNNWIC